MAGMKIEKFTANVATNLCIQSEELWVAAWIKQNVTVSGDIVAAPDGATTADRVTASAGSAVHNVFSTSFTLSAATTYTYSIYLKQGTATFASITVADDGTGTEWFAADVNMGTGEITQTAAGAGSTVVGATTATIGNGWYRVSVTGSNTVAGAASLSVHVSNTGTPTHGNFADFTWTAAGETLYAWGAQLELGTAATSYIRTTSAAVTGGGWWKHPNANTIRLVLIGGGGSGGGGSKQASGTASFGGGGGGGGGIIDIWLGADQLGDSETYTVGSVVSGGAGRVADTGSGATGSNGNSTTFTIGSGGTTLTAYAGGSGQGAGLGNGAGGGAGLSGSGALNAAGANGGGAPGANSVGGSSTNFGCGGGGAGNENAAGAGRLGGNAIFGGAGGGSGGGKTGAPAYADGGAGGGTHLPGGPSPTTAAGTAGANAVGARCGSGGGGGAAHATVQNNGGAGGTPGGGGGGGGAMINGSGVAAGDGGQGARGEIWVITYLNETGNNNFFGVF